MSLSNLFSSLKAGKGRGFHGHAGRPGHRGGSVAGLTLPRNAQNALNKALTYTQPGDVVEVKVLSFDEFRVISGTQDKDVAFYNTQDKKIYVNALKIQYSPSTVMAHEVGHAILDRAIQSKGEGAFEKLWDRHSHKLSGNQRYDMSEGLAEIFAISVADKPRAKRLFGKDSDKILELLT